MTRLEQLETYIDALARSYEREAIECRKVGAFCEAMARDFAAENIRSCTQFAFRGLGVVAVFVTIGDGLARHKFSYVDADSLKDATNCVLSELQQRGFAPVTQRERELEKRLTEILDATIKPFNDQVASLLAGGGE